MGIQYALDFQPNVKHSEEKLVLGSSSTLKIKPKNTFLMADKVGSKMTIAREVFKLSPKDRGDLIITESSISPTDDELNRTLKIANYINLFIKEYFDIIIEEDSSQPSGSILHTENLDAAINDQIKNFYPIALNTLRSSKQSREIIVKNPRNLFEMSGAVTLSSANKVTRNLSTTMGLLWERIASISPHAVNPESEFNLKLKGIDLIALNTKSNKIEYQQLKTKRDTLTGSQRGRSIEELLLHENPVFCVCFPLGSWTFNHPDIPRVDGSLFWKRIGIQYQSVEAALVKLILQLEQAFKEL